MSSIILYYANFSMLHNYGSFDLEKNKKKWSIHFVIIDTAAQVDNVAFWLLICLKKLIYCHLLMIISKSFLSWIYHGV